MQIICGKCNLMGLIRFRHEKVISKLRTYVFNLEVINEKNMFL